MKIYHLKTCDTCRKAIKALRAAGHEPELIDVRADGVDADTLKRFEIALGYETLVNKKSTTETPRHRKRRSPKSRLDEKRPSAIQPYLITRGSIFPFAS